MGCGISKIDPEEGGARPASAFKHHHRRQEHGHGNANVDNPVVVLESINENGIKDEDCVTHFARKSTSSSSAAANGIGTVGVAESDVRQMNRKKTDHSDVEKLNHRGVGRGDNGGNHEGGGGGEEESSNDEDDHIFIPGSPSFREYCVDSRLIRDVNEGDDELLLGINNSKEENNLQEKRSFNCEKVHGSKSSETRRKSTRKGFRRPGWIGRYKKSI